MECCGPPGYASPAKAIKAPRQKLHHTIAIYTGTGIQKSDNLATMDVDPDSRTCSQVIHCLEMPDIGDELQHMGRNACLPCFDDSSMSRKNLILSGGLSNNLHIVDAATDPRAPRLHRVTDGAGIKSTVDLSGPHTVHCLGSEIIISFPGNAKGEAPGGYLHLNKDFEKRKPIQTMYLGEDGPIPLEVKFHHDPDSTHEFCGAALSTNVIHWWKDAAGEWQWEKIIDVGNEPHPEWPIPVPGVMSAILISMDDKYLYLYNWQHGDMRQFDISDRHNPVPTGQVWMGGLPGKTTHINGMEMAGGPQMFQLSLDGKRLYVTTKLFGTWGNQFYPEIREKGGVMVMIDCDPVNGGMKINADFIVDFGKEPNGPGRCHEACYPGGDCTSDIRL